MSQQSVPEGGGDNRLEPSGTAARAGMPRWVKLFGIVLAALILLGVLVMVASGGQHGPGRHRPSTLGTAAAATASVALPLSGGQA